MRQPRFSASLGQPGGHIGPRGHLHTERTTALAIQHDQVYDAEQVMADSGVGVPPFHDLSWPAVLLAEGKGTLGGTHVTAP